MDKKTQMRIGNLATTIVALLRCRTEKHDRERQILANNLLMELNELLGPDSKTITAKDLLAM